MGRPLDVELRRQALPAVRGWVRLKRATRDVLSKPQGSGFGSVLDPHEDFILGLIEADKDITPVEIAGQLAD